MEREYYKEVKNPSKNKTDRYKECKVLEDIETGELLLSMREDIIVPPNSNDTYHRIKEHEICRLDILAHKYYQNPLLWWVIAQANDIYDPIKEISPGTLLRIPSIESLYGNNGILL